jgi:hypothetical protein
MTDDCGRYGGLIRPDINNSATTFTVQRLQHGVCVCVCVCVCVGVCVGVQSSCEQHQVVNIYNGHEVRSLVVRTLFPYIWVHVCLLTKYNSKYLGTA